MPNHPPRRRNQISSAQKKPDTAAAAAATVSTPVPDASVATVQTPVPAIRKRSRLMAFMTHKSMTFWGIVATIFAAFFTTFGAGIYGHFFGGVKAIAPLSVPDNFEKYSNDDFALALPLSANQNDFESAKTYVYKLHENKPDDGRIFKVTVTQGKNAPNEEDLFSDTNIAEAQAELPKLLPTMGYNHGKYDVKSFKIIGFHGHKALSMTLAGQFQLEENGPLESIDFNLLLFYDQKNKKSYSISYPTDAESEVVLSTMNFADAQ